MAREPQVVQEQAPTIAEDLAVRPDAGVPTAQDYAREWGAYTATTDLVVNGSLAVAKGNAVPASHPYLRDSDEYGPGWVSQGAVKLTGDHDAPADLKAAHDAYDAKQAETAPAGSPGPGMFPGR